MRDSAAGFEQADCVIVGASFDTPEENLAFATAQEFPYDLLSDVDHKVGEQYEVVRDDPRFGAFPERFSYLIDRDGIIRRTYQVHDVAGHAEVVLADLELMNHGGG